MRIFSIDSTSFRLRSLLYASGARTFHSLVNYFVSKCAARMRKQISSISRRGNGHVDELCMARQYPGIGELHRTGCDIYTRSGARGADQRSFGTSSETVVAVGSTSTFRQAESSVIIEALRAAAGRIAGKGGAAERLGLKRTTLQNKIRRLGITKVQYQN